MNATLFVHSTCRFTGVGFGPHRKFTASLYVPKQQKRHLGSFETEEQAARAVDEARIKHGLQPVNYVELDHLSDLKDLPSPAVQTPV